MFTPTSTSHGIFFHNLDLLNDAVDICAATTHINRAEVIITSPNYPSVYPVGKTCNIVVNFQEKSPFCMEFLGEFELEESAYWSSCIDFVKIRNGKDSNAPLIMKKCGSIKPHTSYLIGSSVWIQFYSDYGFGMKGFSLKVSQRETCGGKIKPFIRYHL